MIEIDLLKKHGRKVFGLGEHSGPKPSFRERIPEILLEIGIIVFAISLSLWLHNWQEHAGERKKEHLFLTGLRQDLQDDYQELRGDSAAYAQTVAAYAYYRQLTPATQQPAPVDKQRWTLYYTTNFYPKTARFDGLKSSGNLDIVEEETLQTALVHYYQELLPALTSNTEVFSHYKRENIRRYLEEHLRADDTNFLALMRSDPMHNYLSNTIELEVIVKRYHLMLRENRLLTRQVDQVLRTF